MHFVTDEFLARLATDGDDQGAITEVSADENAPYLDIEVLSDLRLDSALQEHVGPYESEDAEQFKSSFAARYRALQRGFDVSTGVVGPAHLIVACGDLVAAPRTGGADELQRVESAYTDVCVPVFEELRHGDCDATSRRLLSVPGNDDATAGAALSASETVKEHPYYRILGAALAENQIPERPEEHPVAAVFRVVSSGPAPAPDAAHPGVVRQPLAYVAVVGFDSNDTSYKRCLVHDVGQIDAEQLRWSHRLVSTLRSGPARSAPLYLLVVTHHNLLPVQDHVVAGLQGEEGERARQAKDLLQAFAFGTVCAPGSTVCIAAGSTSNASEFMDHCQQLRASIVLHRAVEQRSSLTLTNVPLEAMRPAADLTVLAIPAFEPDCPASGMARIRLDLWKGEARIAVLYDSDAAGVQARPVQISHPLLSASRITSGERRLYTRVSQLVEKALVNGGSDTEIDPDAVQQFADQVSTMWREEGYAALTPADGTKLPRLGNPVRRNRYFLLLLLRSVGRTGYQILLSRHTPQRVSEVADWDTLLMPAFTSVRSLMEHMRLDVLRQVIDQAEDLERAQSAREFEAAVESIERSNGNIADDIWQDQIRELEIFKRVKISPTTGQLTEYEYRLVVLRPFIEDPSEWDDARREEWKHAQTMVGWFKELPSVLRSGPQDWSGRTFPIEAIMTGGAGLRWEPAADVYSWVGAVDDVRRSGALPPGTVWFPLRDRDESPSPWQLVPSIVARNADVMAWVDEELGKKGRRQGDGTFQPHVVMSKLQSRTGYLLKEGPFPFDAEPGFTSSRQAMNDVEYSELYDLGGKGAQRPYQGLSCRRMALVRCWLRVPSGRLRDVIAVFDVREGSLEQFAHLCGAEIGPKSGMMGLLRPAQRYVLRTGIERARLVNDFLSSNLNDPWGFLRATFGGLGDSLALTPPIIELVSLDDVDSDDENRLEFLVCDGNHRVVQRVWRDRHVGAAIGVVDPPVQPYYARPFSPYEWDMTSDNELDLTPPPLFRHAPRRVDPSVFSGGVPDIMKDQPRDQWYRRYFRDLTKGFGYMGGQGGRYL